MTSCIRRKSSGWQTAHVGFLLATSWLGFVNVAFAKSQAGQCEFASSSHFQASTCVADPPAAGSTASYAAVVSSTDTAAARSASGPPVPAPQMLRFELESPWTAESRRGKSTDFCFPSQAASDFSASAKRKSPSSEPAATSLDISQIQPPASHSVSHDSKATTAALSSSETSMVSQNALKSSTSEVALDTSTPAPTAALTVVTPSASDAPHRSSDSHTAHATKTASSTSATPSQLQNPLSVSPKTYKERFNFASFDCGALILAHNPEANSATSILHNSKDAYMLNKCEAKRFVTVELCDEILVDTIMLANFEFFSSMFKDFQVHVSNRYPPKDNRWTLLGDFRAKNVRDFQYFKVGNPRTWARYLRVSFISEYSHEYYCPISMLKVYGTTMMEEVKAEEDKQSALDATLLRSDDPVTLPGRGKEAREPRPPGFLPPTSHQRSSPMPLIGSLKKSWSQNPAGIEFMDAFGTTPLPVFSRSDVQSVSSSAKDILLPQQFYAATNADTSGRLPEALRSQSTVADRDSLAKAIGDSAEAVTAAEPGQDSPPSSAHASSSGTQESFFKTILKRINLLERNATIANMFLEEQSKALNDVFRQSLSREQERFDALLDHFNNTLYHIFTDLHMEYTKSWVMIMTDVESEQQRADAKIAEVNRLMEALDKQMSRQLAAQSLMLVAAVLGGWILCSLFHVLFTGRLMPASTPVGVATGLTDGNSDLVSSPTADHGTEFFPSHTNGQEMVTAPSISFEETTSLITPQASPIKPPESKSALKKKRKRRRSTIAPQASGGRDSSPHHQTQQPLGAARSEGNIALAHQRARRNSFSPGGLRLLNGTPPRWTGSGGDGF
ncbi:hypothetical protein HDU90_006297 [Geranomyces variabilis]|nr:hypothetical protein HDU90_006297 [Geranomyces variabilis]